MPKFIIERDLSGAGDLSESDFKGMAQRSNEIAKDMDPPVHWIESYVTGDKVFCVYVAENEEQMKEHAEKGKFPCTNVAKIVKVIDRTTAE